MHQLCKLHWIFMVEFCWTEELKSDQRQFHFIQLRTNLKANSKTRFDSVMNRRETSKDLSECVRSVVGLSEWVRSLSSVSECVRSVSGVSECVRSLVGVSKCVRSVAGVSECVRSLAGVSECVRSVSGVSECVRSVAGDVPCQYNYDDHFIIPQLAGGWPCCQHFSLPRHPRADQPGCYQDRCQINKHLTSTSTQLNGTSPRCGSISSSGSVS